MSPARRHLLTLAGALSLPASARAAADGAAAPGPKPAGIGTRLQPKLRCVRPARAKPDLRTCATARSTRRHP